MVVLWLISTPLVSDFFLSLTESPPTSLENSLEAPYPLVVVLGGMTNMENDYYFVPGFSEEVERILSGMHLVESGQGEKLLFTGGSGSLVRKIEITEGERVGQWLSSQMSPNDYILETQSRNTRENALFSKNLILAETGGAPILLVTSAFHMKRAKGCFEKLGISVVPYPVDYRQIKEKGFMLFIPNEEALLNFSLVTKEFLGLIVYKLRGFI